MRGPAASVGYLRPVTGTPTAILLLFDVSGGELLLILLFVLLFFGSKGIPDIARTLGRTMRQLRDASAEVQREIHREAREVGKSFEEQRRSFRIEPPSDAVSQTPPEQGPAQEGHGADPPAADPPSN